MSVSSSVLRSILKSKLKEIKKENSKIFSSFEEDDIDKILELMQQKYIETDEELINIIYYYLETSEKWVCTIDDSSAYYDYGRYNYNNAKRDNEVECAMSRGLAIPEVGEIKEVYANNYKYYFKKDLLMFDTFLRNLTSSKYNDMFINLMEEIMKKESEKENGLRYENVAHRQMIEFYKNRTENYHQGICR